MTKEKKMARLAELRQEAENGVSKYNELFQNGKIEEAFRCNESIDASIKEYTQIARDITFDEILEAENPMVEAVRRLTFESIAAKNEKRDFNETEKIPVLTIVTVNKNIDVLKLHNYAKKIGYGNIGKEKNWDYLVQKFNFLLTVQTAVDIGVNPKEIKDCYDIAAIARDIDMGKTPTSKTNILKTLQMVVTAMLGDGYKVTSHDVNFLLKIYNKKGKSALSVVCANHRFMRQYICEICHRVVTDGKYEAVYKKAKTN